MTLPSAALTQLDPRVKILLTLVFVLFVVLTPPREFRQFAAYTALILALILLARLPILATLRRSLVVLPFVLLVALSIPFLKGDEPMPVGSYNLGPLSLSRSGLLILWNVTIKSWLSALATITLLSTGSLPELLQGLEGLRVPRSLVLLLSFLLRYFPMFASQVARMQRALEARSWRGIRQLSLLGNLVGALFIRSYERGERIYKAMLARGFTGEARRLGTPPPTPREIVLFGAFLGLLIAVRVMV